MAQLVAMAPNALLGGVVEVAIHRQGIDERRFNTKLRNTILNCSFFIFKHHLLHQYKYKVKTLI